MTSAQSSDDVGSTIWAFVREIHRWPLSSPHKGPATRKMFPFDDVIMFLEFHADPYNEADVINLVRCVCPEWTNEDVWVRFFYLYDKLFKVTGVILSFQCS